MPLTKGTKVGPYEIVEPLGAGGMGEVYRARDTRLNRDVAIKILPEVFLSDPDRRARFEREATTLASLNHPHIAQIHGFEESGGTPALVMELVEGEDLSRRLTRGPIPLEESLAIARQIADALDSAHDRGIVHRDLKPANIKIRDDGVVKVLDFGLAKALEPHGAGLAKAFVNSPTLTAAATGRGVIVGTAAYMAPEQAKGKPVDRRADIWAFGVVVYEMLSGRAAFDGETFTDLLAAVVTRDPDWSALPRETPPALRRLLERCLRKDPKERLRDIGDAKLEIIEMSARPQHLADAVEGAGSAHRPWGMPALAIAFLGAAAIGWAGAGLWQPVAAPSIGYRQLTELPGPERHPDISPDGRQLIYSSGASGNLDIYLLRIGGDRAINLTAGSLDHDSQPAFSPDGQSIAFHSTREGGGLFVMGATGESVRRLTSGGFDPTWSPDGRSIAYATQAVDDPYSRSAPAEIWRVEIQTGEPTRVAGEDAVQPAWSPDGGRIAFWANTHGQRDIWTVPAGGGAPRLVTNEAATDWSPRWSPDGRWLYFSSDRSGSMNLWRVAVDQRTGATRGEPQQVTSSVQALGHVRVAAGGSRLVAMAYDRTSQFDLYELGPLAATATLLRTLQPRSAQWCSPAPDGVWLACTTRGSQEDVILLRTDGSDLRRLTNDAQKDRVPVWSPDGQALAFFTTRSGEWDYWTIRIDGSDLRQLTSFGEARHLIWSPDGRSAIVNAHRSESWRLSPYAVATRETAQRLTPPSPAFIPLAWSRSGARLAGAELDTARNVTALAVWDLDASAYRSFELQVPLPLPHAVIGGWLADSRRFVARSHDGVVVLDTADGTSRRLLAGGPRDFLHVTPDGRLLLVEREVLDSDIWMLELK